MKRPSTFGQGWIKTWIVSVAALCMALIVGAAPASALAALPTNGNDTANQVIGCGVGTISQLQHDYHNGDGHNTTAQIQAVFNFSTFGISTADIDGMSDTNTFAGTVSKRGDVTISSGDTSNANLQNADISKPVA